MPEPLDLATPLAWALAYAQRGWHVLPLEPGHKQPLGRLVPRGMLDATTDPEVIGKWWRVAPSAGVGIALAPSGLVALDIDPRNGGTDTFEQLQAEHGSLRSEVMAFTGGGGEHHVFVVPPGVHVSLPGTLGPGVDVKANGYIVVEPSLHPSGKQYAWEVSSSPLDGVAPSPLPDWLRSLRVELKRTTHETGAVAVDAPMARDLREALYVLDADDRDTWLHAGMALHSTGWGHPAYAMWCAWSQQSTKFDSTDQRKTWESFKAPTERGNGLTAAWVFGRAQMAGWVNPRASVRQAVPHDEPQPPMHPDESGQDVSGSLPFLSLSELQSSASAVRWLVKGILPAESLGMMFGGSGAFKSFIAIDLACHVAHSMQWCGKRTGEGPVLFIAAEGGSGLWKRIEAWHKLRGLDWRDAPIYVVPVAVDLANDCMSVVEAAKKAGVTPSLVIVDTLSQTFVGEENSATEVSAYLRELGLMFRALWRACVLVIHHTGHQATERPRGSSALRANLDFMFGTFRDGEDLVATLTCEKQKDDDKFDEIPFSMTKCELGKDEDGDPITSLVASRVRDGNEMLEIMRDQVDHGRKGYGATLIGLAKDGMSEKELRSAFYEACDLGNSDSKSKAYRRAAEWARKAGVLAVSDGHVRIFRTL